MQFPTIPSQKVTPVVRRDVTPVAPTTAVASSERSLVTRAPVVPAANPPPLVAGPDAERRQGSRRDASDRRRGQQPVILDTRTGRDRRGERRRVDDPMPGRLDESA